MNVIKETNRHPENASQKIFSAITGAALLLVTAFFPQTLWAGNNDRIIVNRIMSDLEVVVVDLVQRSSDYSSNGQYYFKKRKFARHRPVVRTYRRHYREPAYNRDCRNWNSYRRYRREHYRPDYHRPHRERRRHTNYYPWRDRWL